MKYFKILLVFVALFSLSLTSVAQIDAEKLKESLKNASFREKLEAANMLMEDQLYHFAKDILLNLVEEQPDNANVNYKTGLCLLNISNERTKALPYLITAEKGVSKKYNPFSPLEKAAPIETRFYIAKAYHLNEQMDKAIENYNLFLDEISKKHIKHPEAVLGVKQCEYGKVKIKTPKAYKITNIGDVINNEYDDYSAVITPDESMMFYTSRRARLDSSNQGTFSPQDGKYFEDVYVSYKDFKADKWGEPELLSNISSPRSNQATISVSGDGQKLFIYKDIKGDGQIHVSEYDDKTETYARPKILGEGSDINKEDAWETHATLSADGRTLYFVSDREGGLGGRDIYKSVILPNGKWSMAQNLGAPINTPYDEESPFFHPDGKTLYFSSNGENSIGGFDIFYTKSTEDENGRLSWSDPVNMGYPLNSVDDDIFFMTNASGSKGYFSGIRKDNYGEKDIYSVAIDKPIIDEFAILKGRIEPGEGKTLPDGIMIYVTDETEGGDPMEYKPNKRNGSYIFNLKPCHDYLVEYTLNDETFYETEFKVPCDADYNETDIVLNLDGIRLDGSKVEKDPVLLVDEDTTALPEGDKTKWKYRLLVNGKPYISSALVEFMDGNKMLLKEFIDKDGYFNYHELENEKSALKMITFDDPTLCDDLSLKLFDENNKLIKVTKIDVKCKTSIETFEPIVFQKFYGYNLNGIGSDEKRWTEFMNSLESMVKNRGYAQVEVEGSASRVPTRTYKNNDNLSKIRSDAAVKLLKEELQKRGISESKVKIIAIKSKVQGPKYKYDFKNTEKYGPYQYIKIDAR